MGGETFLKKKLLLFTSTLVPFFLFCEVRIAFFPVLGQIKFPLPHFLLDTLALSWTFLVWLAPGDQARSIIPLW